MKAYYTATEKILEDRLGLLVKLLSNRSKMCLNRNLKHLDKETKNFAEVFTKKNQKS